MGEESQLGQPGPTLAKLQEGSVSQFHVQPGPAHGPHRLQWVRAPQSCLHFEDPSPFLRQSEPSGCPKATGTSHCGEARLSLPHRKVWLWVSMAPGAYTCPLSAQEDSSGLPEELTPQKGLWATQASLSQGCTPELEPAPTFLGENTPSVPPSSLMATPISASRASLEGQCPGQLEPRGHRTCLTPNRPIGQAGAGGDLATQPKCSTQVVPHPVSDPPRETCHLIRDQANGAMGDGAGGGGESLVRGDEPVPR